MPKYAKNARITTDALEKIVVKGVKGFVPIGDEPLHKELISTRLPESKMKKLKQYLEKNDLTKSQWARKVIEDAIARLDSELEEENLKKLIQVALRR